MFVEVIAAFVGSIFFSILFDIDRDSLLHGGMAGAFSWLGYRVAYSYVNNTVLALFIAALLVAFLSELAARLMKKPVTIFMIPGIVTLVPGAPAYFTMFHFVRGNYTLGLATGAETMFSAGAIAAGIALVSVLFRGNKEKVGGRID